MCRGFLRRDGHAALQGRFTSQAIRRLDLIRRVSVKGDVFQRKEPVQLAGIFTPSASLDHQVGWLFACSLVFWQLPQDRLILRQRRITYKEFDKEWPVLAGLRVLRGERVPPPIVTVVGQRAVEHECVAGDIVMIEHGSGALPLCVYGCSA